MTDLRQKPAVVPDDDATDEAIVAPGPSDVPTEDARWRRWLMSADDAPESPESPESPYYLREWRGGALYGCPQRDFLTRSHEAVVTHIEKAHPRIPEPDLKTRAARAGIILAHR